ncbi:MAG: response regulator transcription factor [Bacteroidetes bacterium]|nr:response regulator transcription factor [Bacteroidota bacterium]
MTNLYIIDDHYLIIEGLYSSFDLESNEFKVIGGSLSVTDALERISPNNVDIIILDLFIHQSDPIINIELIRKTFPSIPVVILSQESSLLWQVKMFRHGVKAYINKLEDKAEMRQKLLNVSKGETMMSNEVVEIIMKGDQKGSGILSSENKGILSFLLQGLTAKEIALKMSQSKSSIEKKLKKNREVYKVRNNYELIIKLLHKQTSPLFL